MVDYFRHANISKFYDEYIHTYYIYTEYFLPVSGVKSFESWKMYKSLTIIDCLYTV